MNEEVPFEEMVPVAASFVLGEIEFHLRPMSLDDRAWLTAKFGDKEAGDALKFADVRALMPIVYHQLTQESRSKVKAQKISGYIDDQGIEHPEKMITGPEVLSNMLMGVSDQAGILKAFNRMVGISNPKADEAIDEIKKKALETQREMYNLLQSAGQESLTSSATSTDGPGPTSEVSP